LTDDAPETPAERAERKTILPKAIVAVCLGFLVVIAAMLATMRYGVLLPQARLLIEARAEGLKIGRMGKLHIEGLEGDVWRDLKIRRLTITDEKGVWLEARNLRLAWRYAELLRRRFDADLVAAENIRLVRRPTLTPKGPPGGGMPVSFLIDRLQGRVEMEPAFSGRKGVYDLKGSLAIERNGRRAGQIAVASLLHPGDRLDAKFDLGEGRPLLVTAAANEAEGGALAGSLGLPADRAFRLKLDARGTMSQGRFDAETWTGNSRPLWAKGGWAPGGGEAAGTLDLTASKLTAGLAERLGPRVVFVGAGRKAGPELFALDLRARAANLSATARGFGDVGKRRAGPQGLELNAQAADLSKVAGARAGEPGGAALWRRQGLAAEGDRHGDPGGDGRLQPGADLGAGGAGAEGQGLRADRDPAGRGRCGARLRGGDPGRRAAGEVRGGAVGGRPAAGAQSGRARPWPEGRGERRADAAGRPRLPWPGPAH
jgi:translocation and assembly module TamB